jgi:tRNA(Ile)-lysidine synthase
LELGQAVFGLAFKPKPPAPLWNDALLGGRRQPVHNHNNVLRTSEASCGRQVTSRTERTRMPHNINHLCKAHSGIPPLSQPAPIVAAAVDPRLRRSAAARATRPIGPRDFARMMAAVGPFEARPRLAVAVSGGADSLALALLCQAWAAARGGEAIALTVDHGLRPASAAEARQVVGWLAARGIARRRLVWRHPDGKPVAALQAEAREARYRLLTNACRRAGVLHLLLAHHAGDQAETMLMRLARGGGPDGLAGMAAVVARDGVRLVRPLLGVPPARLRATLRAAGQEWIEDPSNSDPRFERVRWRSMIPPALAPDIASAGVELGVERRRRDGEVGDLLAAARFDPAGFVAMPRAAVAAAAAENALRAVARCLVAVGGDAYAPARGSLARLLDGVLRDGRGRTLGGCRVLGRAESLLICREPAAATEVLAAGPGKALWWDRRFALRARLAGKVARLGELGWLNLPAGVRHRDLPREVVASLPALWRAGRPVAVPHLGYGTGLDVAGLRPAQPLLPGGFTVAKLNVNIM